MVNQKYGDLFRQSCGEVVYTGTFPATITEIKARIETDTKSKFAVIA